MKTPIRILIADDNTSARNGLKNLMVTETEIELVGEAANGEEAVMLVEEHHPDIVLMDVRMPVIDGLEATQIIKQRWPQVRVILLTMYPAYKTDSLSAGADAFLVKGCEAEEIFEAIYRSKERDDEI